MSEIMKKLWLKGLLGTLVVTIMILIFYNRITPEIVFSVKPKVSSMENYMERKDQPAIIENENSETGRKILLENTSEGPNSDIENDSEEGPVPDQDPTFSEEPLPDEAYNLDKENVSEEGAVLEQDPIFDEDSLPGKDPTSDEGNTSDEDPISHEETIADEPKCKPKKNMVYLKTHKTASSAVQNVIMRRALKEKLRILQPGNSHDFGYPRKFMMSKPPAVPANLLCHHARFNHELMSRIMPDDSVWVSSVREPLSLAKSTLSYFRPIVPAFQRIPMGESIEKWFDQAATFTATSKKSQYSHFAKNPTFFDFGFDNRRDNDARYLNESIAKLDGIFDLVLIADHFDESMVLLSDLLCWPIEEFACLTLNARKEDPKKKISDADQERIRTKVRNWNKADTLLFDHFNATLWKKIDEYGRDRMNEKLTQLRRETERLSGACLAKSQPVDIASLNFKARKGFYQPPGVKLTGYQLREDATDPACKHLVQPENSFSTEVFKLQNMNYNSLR